MGPIKKKYCSAYGWEHALKSQTASKQHVTVVNNAVTGTGSNSLREGAEPELYEMLFQKGLADRPGVFLLKFIAEHKPAPHVTQTDTGTVGSLMKVAYTDKGGIEEEFVCILGAENEPWIYGDIPVVSYESLLGRQLIKQSVGYEFYITLDGEKHPAEIVGIELPPEPDFESVAIAA